MPSRSSGCYSTCPTSGTLSATQGQADLAAVRLPHQRQGERGGDGAALCSLPGLLDQDLQNSQILHDGTRLAI